ncbi:MAG: hypothetical protein LBQ99_00780 [Endomicrobium sp.]|nr:hypothetical protein [Endomicrobium sp.]
MLYRRGFLTSIFYMRRKDAMKSTKRFFLAVMLCCTLCAVGNAIGPLLLGHGASWDEDGHCYNCRKTGDANECTKCNGC